MDQLKSIFARVLNIDATAVTPELSPENTPSWDSLNAIVLITEIEKAYNIKFEFDEAMAMKTYQDVVDRLTAKGVPNP